MNELKTMLEWYMSCEDSTNVDVPRGHRIVVGELLKAKLLCLRYDAYSAWYEITPAGQALIEDFK